MPHSPDQTATLLEHLEAILERQAGPERDRVLATLLGKIRPEDVAEALAGFSAEEKVAIFRALPREDQAEVIDETDDGSRETLVESLPSQQLTAIIEQMPPDEATDLLEDLPDEQKERVLRGLEPTTAGEVRQLLQHPPESAGGIMTSDFIAVGPEESAREVLELLQRTIDTEVVSYVYVVDEGEHLIGVASIRDLIVAEPETAIREFMEVDVICAEVTEDQEDVANLARKYNLKSIPIVDAARRLLGLATIDDIVHIISEEADEDIYRLAGTAGSHPAQQKVLRRAMVRIPWLLLPVASGFIIARMQRGKLSPEATQLLLAPFIPLVMGIAGGVGTQSATMIVRGIATGDIDLKRKAQVFLQELVIGVVIAVAIGVFVTVALGLVLGLEGQENSRLISGAVGTGLAGGIVLASVCGTLFPLGCELIGLDPALVAGPFITSFNDVLAAVVYLALAEGILFLGS
ncbi:MAG: magnesium transporter [Planctomycetota bacterium]